ncbi:Aste57867_5918 [Aphanomyces stellatus]|uniref:Aste57867_5918 protein n=1 Tax=Aphanomyces stellatus TaxID=120398 RepID=A0A485KF95_9STRA|nr:hypothetical protein As57867_005904 [Aphanomyces stellatus]VFT82939.1 Aste57867_5918 [Aphanomyces stellatus]
MHLLLVLLLALATTVVAQPPAHRWHSTPCVDVEGGARYCIPTNKPCQGTVHGECPQAGTLATALCQDNIQCALPADTVCELRPATGQYACVLPKSTSQNVAPIAMSASKPADVPPSNAMHASLSAAKPESSIDSSASTTTGSATFVVVGAVGAVAVVALVAFRARRLGQANVTLEDSLVTPAVPHPDEETPDVNQHVADSGGSLTPTLVTSETPQIVSV